MQARFIHAYMASTSYVEVLTPEVTSITLSGLLDGLSVDDINYGGKNILHDKPGPARHNSENLLKAMRFAINEIQSWWIRSAESAPETLLRCHTISLWSLWSCRLWALGIQRCSTMFDSRLAVFQSRSLTHLWDCLSVTIAHNAFSSSCHARCQARTHVVTPYIRRLYTPYLGSLCGLSPDVKRPSDS